MGSKVESLAIDDAMTITNFMKKYDVQHFQLGDLKVSFREEDEGVVIQYPPKDESKDDEAS